MAVFTQNFKKTIPWIILFFGPGWCNCFSMAGFAKRS